MKHKANQIESSQQNTKDINGYYYEGNDGSQLAFWTCYSDQVSKAHQHPFDEYTVVVSGQYTAMIDGKEIVLNPGDEILIPKGTLQDGRCVAGTRTISAFGGKRIKKRKVNMKQTNDYVSVYKKLLEQGDLQVAYERLLKYLMGLKAHFSTEFSDKYQVGNVSPGYMDFSYFPFFNDDLRSKKLRFGIVLNHEKIQFELWLMGQNAKIQEEYWNLLKTTKWNKERISMPKYSVLETVLVTEPNFNQPDELTAQIEEIASTVSEEIWNCIRAAG